MTNSILIPPANFAEENELENFFDNYRVVGMEAYKRLSSEEKTYLKAGIVREYLERRGKQGIESFAAQFSQRDWKKGEVHYNINSEVITHVLRNLERNLGSVYRAAERESIGEEFSSRDKKLAPRERTTVYGIVQDKATEARKIGDAKKILGWKSLYSSFRDCFSRVLRVK